MYLKVMSNENLPDQHYAKLFVIRECKEVSFYRNEVGNPCAWVDGDSIGLQGNAYILNAAGKTIDSFSCNAATAPTP